MRYTKAKALMNISYRPSPENECNAFILTRFNILTFNAFKNKET
jgi:hypothetical protein